MRAMRTAGVMLVVAACFAAGPRVQAQPAVDRGEDDVATAPVEIDGTVLFRLRGVSSFPAGVRAQLVSDRLRSVAADPALSVDSLRVVESEGTSAIVAGSHPLLTVVDADAALEQVGRSELARTHLLRLQQAIADYRAARSPVAIRRAAINTLLATVVFVTACAGLIWFWRRLDALLTQRLHARIHSVGIQSLELVRAEKIWAALRNGFQAVRTVVFLAGGLVYVGYVLRQWPRTRGLARDLAGFALGPLEVLASGFVTNIPRLVFLAVLFVVIRFALKLIRLFFEAVGGATVKLSGFDPEWAQPTYKIVRVAVVAFGLIVAYPYIPGSESAAFKGVSLFMGIVFSLGSSSAISNIVAGYMMTYRRAFRVGDRVKIGDSIGDVIEMRIQVTHLRSFKNEEIIIPNSQILASEVRNYSSLSRAHGLILHTEVGIGYETPWRQVEAMLLTAAARCAAPGEDPPRAFVLLKKLGDFAVVYELNVYCAEVKTMVAMYTRLHRHVLDVFNEYGVQIMTPAYEGDPEQPKVVPPKDFYAAPALPPDAGAAAANPGGQGSRESVFSGTS